jgi:hypothetical protein
MGNASPHRRSAGKLLPAVLLRDGIVFEPSRQVAHASRHQLGVSRLESLSEFIQRQVGVSSVVPEVLHVSLSLRVKGLEHRIVYAVEVESRNAEALTQ